MKKLIFIKTYFKKADSLWKQVVGLNLSSLIGELWSLYEKMIEYDE